MKMLLIFCIELFIIFLLRKIDMKNKRYTKKDSKV